MDAGVEITFSAVDEMPSLAATVRRKAAKLCRMGAHLEGCRVSIARVGPSVPGSRYVVRLTVKGPTDVHERELTATHANPYLAVRDVFRTARQWAPVAGGRRHGHHTGHPGARPLRPSHRTAA